MSKRKIEEVEKSSTSLSAVAARRAFGSKSAALEVSSRDDRDRSAPPLAPLPAFDPEQERIQGDKSGAQPWQEYQRRSVLSSSSDVSVGHHDSRRASSPGDSEFSLNSSSSSESLSERSVASQSRQLSTFRPNSHNVICNSREKLQVILHSGETLAILGQFDLRVLAGAVTFWGARLSSSQEVHRVFVSSTHSIPYIMCATGEDRFQRAAEIELLACKCGIRLLKKISPHFARIWNGKNKKARPLSEVSEVDERSFAPIYDSADDEFKRRLNLLDMPFLWTATISDITERESQRPTRVLVCGPKASGKSTFARLLINSLLTNVKPAGLTQTPDRNGGIVFLDVDPGQPEFSPPGQLSLVHLQRPNLGPPFSHPHVYSSSSNRLVRAHSIAAISPNADPLHFQACVDDLLHHYRENLSTLPLIINCPGWILGGGLEIVRELIQSSSPSDVIYMSEKGPPDIVHILKESSAQAEFRCLPSQISNNRQRTSLSLRAMQTTSYFHLSSPQQGHIQWDATSVTAQQPWIVRYDGPNAGILGIMTLGELVAEDQLTTVLDGSLVAVVVLEGALALPGSSQLQNPYSKETEPSDRANTGALERIDVDDASLLTVDVHVKEQAITGRENDYERESIHHTPAENLPYLYTDFTNAPIDPSKSHCIGMALVRGIDVANHTLQLLTPISKHTIKRLMQRKSRIVLVHGKLDTPIWAYVEDLAREAKFAKSEQKAAPQGKENDGELTERMRRKDRGKIPWVTMQYKEVGRKESKGGEIWKVRRNLAFRDDRDTTGRQAR